MRFGTLGSSFQFKMKIMIKEFEIRMTKRELNVIGKALNMLKGDIEKDEKIFSKEFKEDALEVEILIREYWNHL